MPEPFGLNAGSASSSESRAMLEAARPDVYRLNAFRVLGLPVTATERDWIKHQKRLEKMAKLGLEEPPGAQQCLPLIPKPDSSEIQDATARLRDPEKRLIDELLWFWPQVDSNSDEGLEQLRNGKVGAAISCWFNQRNQKGVSTVAAHNLAVINHLLALDAELTPSADETSELKELRDHYWQEAYRNWRLTIKNDKFWARIRARIRELDDPRLPVDATDRLRSTLPKMLVIIGARLVLDATKHRNPDDARRLLGYLDESSLSLKPAKPVIAREFETVLESVEQTCAKLAVEANSCPKSGLEIAGRVFSETEASLAILKVVSVKGSDYSQHARNLVCDAVTECAVSYGNETEDWQECLSVLKRARQLNPSGMVAKRLTESLQTVSNNVEVERASAFVSKAVAAKEAGDMESAVGHLEQALAVCGESKYRQQVAGWLKDAREEAELRQDVAGDKAYDVTVGTQSIRVPGACSCCLGKALRVNHVSHSWEESAGYNRKIKRTVSLDVPVCDECKQHQNEFSLKRSLLVAGTIIASILVYYGVAKAMYKPGFWPFMIGGAVVSTALIFAGSAFIRLSPLPSNHASRDVAVRIASALPSIAVFRCYNPVFAQAFASANDTKAVPTNVNQPPRGTYILAGEGAVLSVLVAVLVAGIAHWITYANVEWEVRPSRPSASAPAPRASRNTRPRPYTAPKRTTPTRSPSLASRIDSGKKEARAMESALADLDSKIATAKRNIDICRGQMEGYKSRAAAGRYVNGADYRKVVATHNSWVRHYNSILAQRKAQYARYNAKLKEVNAMVARYNWGER